MLVQNKNKASIASYYGWAAHCNSKHLLKKLLAVTTIVLWARRLLVKC